MPKLDGTENVRLRLAAVGKLTGETEMHERRLRVVRAAFLILLVLILGSLGFYQLTGGRHSLLECLYMTVITVSTVGFREVIPARESEAVTVFTILLTLFGVGAVLYFLTTLTTMIVEGDLQYGFWRRRLEKKIQGLRNHVLVVGAGRCGGQVVRELWHSGAPLVVLELDPARVELLASELRIEFPFVLGDALEDANLRAAGIERARGLIAALHEDRDNLFLSLSARQLNPSLRIVAKVDDRSSFEKFERVGVNAVVSPPMMGGRHLVSEMLRPDVATFVDGLLRVTESAPALSELGIAEDAPVAGRSLGEADLRAKTHCLILGIRAQSSSFYTYNPGPQEMLQPGSSVIALGDMVALERLRGLLQTAKES
ncbi:MAG: potassium channel family protein [Candidatus Krumholzibacteriia bacterium]